MRIGLANITFAYNVVSLFDKLPEHHKESVDNGQRETAEKRDFDSVYSYRS